MARVTVEDCVERIPNRFELVMLAAKRSREISSGSSLTVERDNDKNPSLLCVRSRTKPFRWTTCVKNSSGVFKSTSKSMSRKRTMKSK